MSHRPIIVSCCIISEIYSGGLKTNRIANRAQTQAEAAHKQTTGDLQRARTALQALRATHVAEIKKREKEVEAMRERWSKLADAQLRVASLPSGMVLSRSAANASVLSDSGCAGVEKKGVVEGALEEAEKAGALLREENRELKGLVVDAANAVRKILHKAVSSDPDDLEFVCLSFSFLSALVMTDDVVGTASSLGHHRPFPSWRARRSL